MINRTKLNILLATLIISGAVTANTVHALTFSQDIGVSFTFNPSIAVTLSSANLTIPNLTPGTASDSNIITVNVKTNNVTGYTLNATVGNNTTYNTRDLKHQSNTVTDKFSSVDFGSNIAANTDLTDNTWAYSFSVDNGEKWLADTINGVIDGYSGLPLYNDETNITTLKASTGPAESASGDDIRFKIAARASNEITSGEYNNVINFVAVANPAPKTLEMAYEDAGKTKLNGYYKMQDMSSAICDAAEVIEADSMMQVIDIRDNNIYHITKLADGNCWMLDNLALDPTDSTTASNMDENNTNATSTAINNFLNGGSSTAGWSSIPVANVNTNFNSFTEPRINNASKNTLVTSYGPASVNGQAKAGIFYNYCATSVGTYCYADGGGVDVPDTIIDASQDLCPANWRIPTGGITGEYVALYQSYPTTNDATNSASYQYNLSVSFSGYTLDGEPVNQGQASIWWSSTYSDSTYMRVLSVSPTNTFTNLTYDRNFGSTIRCLATN